MMKRHQMLAEEMVTVILDSLTRVLVSSCLQKISVGVARLCTFTHSLTRPPTDGTLITLLAIKLPASSTSEYGSRTHAGKRKE